VADDDEIEAPHPRETAALFGHAEDERALLESYRSGRMPHAWLLGGPRGIGKATLAYRMARFVLVHPDPAAPQVQSASSLAVDAEHPVARRIAAQAQPDLLVLERTVGETGKLRQDIAVDDVRRSVSFFGSTAGEGGWRIAIIDAVDELNRYGANALLKILEEPPRRALLLLVSHAPGATLATIRSRSRLLRLRPLSDADVARAAAAALGRRADEVTAAAEAAEGSVARAITLLDGSALLLRKRVADLLENLPDLDPRALHALGDALAGTDARTLSAFIDAINGWLSARLDENTQDKRRLARVAEVWEKVNHAARDVEIFNLERKPLVFAVFGLLADAARG
jgi:DNA polymerase-3 subunit delta'